jgi:hypothetical protein
MHFYWQKVAWRRFLRTSASLPAAKSVVFAAYVGMRLPVTSLG